VSTFDEKRRHGRYPCVLLKKKGQRRVVAKPRNTGSARRQTPKAGRRKRRFTARREVDDVARPRPTTVDERQRVLARDSPTGPAPSPGAKAYLPTR
jgi:hypothetical protein